jgi:hypothetical protein
MRDSQYDDLILVELEETVTLTVAVAVTGAAGGLVVGGVTTSGVCTGASLCITKNGPII